MYVNLELISIHAPAGGASRRPDGEFLQSIYFNSRPCGRGFTETDKLNYYRIVFQFTPLREGLQGLSGLANTMGAFQFTPLREGLPGNGTGCL